MKDRTKNTLIPLSLGMAASYHSFVMDALQEDTLARAMPEKWNSMLRGMALYCSSTEAVPALSLREVWRAGEVSLQCLEQADYAAYAKRAAVLLVPSMINGSQVFNLMQGHSFIEWLHKNGFAPYILDWGDGAADEGQFDFDAAISSRLLPAVHHLADLHRSRVHAMGYCMGGLLLLAAGVLDPKPLCSASFLATPWDFHAGSQALLKRVQYWSHNVMRSQDSPAGSDWMHMIFASMDPMQVVAKFARFAAMDKTSEEARIFFATEDWLSEGRRISPGLAFQTVQSLFLENQTLNKSWAVCGQCIDPRLLPVPSLVVASRRDRLVEYETARPLFASLKQAAIIIPDCGHIGMMASRRAAAEVWEPYLQWIGALETR